MRSPDYICLVADLLNNPVYNALLTGDVAFSFGTERVKFFDELVSPFAGFDESYDAGFDDLGNILPQGRKILYANPKPIDLPDGWNLLAHIGGLQFVLDNYQPEKESVIKPVPLYPENVEEMIRLAKLTKPGPFDKRTIEFGYYFGIFENERLVAMTGQRLHVSNFTEVSAVCTHPDQVGKGYARVLMHHQIHLILRDGKIPFLHVRADNTRAIDLYERIGFKMSRPMNFYFLKKDKKAELI